MVALVAGEYPLLGYTSGDISSETIYIFTKGHEIKSIHSVPAPPIPEVLRFGICGAKVGDKLIVGNASSLYIYNVSLSKWCSINRSKVLGPQCSRTSVCKLNSNTMIIVGGDGLQGDTVELLIFNNADTRVTSYRPISSVISSTLSCSSTNQRIKCPTKLPVKVAYNSIINIDEGKVLLAGGNVMGIASNRVFQGTISPNGTNVIWKELSPLNIARSNHVCFRLNNAIFVAGGYGSRWDKLSCSERYDSERDVWLKDTIYHPESEEGDLDLPFPLVDASVVVDRNQTFAAIIGGVTEMMYFEEEEVVRLEDCPSSNVIIFTINEGFKCFQNFNLLSNRKQHACLPIH
jgi:hypothetical protein